MVFATTKQVKECFYCKKQVANLGMHVAKMHPNVFEKIDDSPIIRDEDSKNTPPLNVVKTNSEISNYRGSNFRDILNEKLDQMLSIKVIQMLEKGASIQDVQNLINPPQPKGINLEELKAYKELFVNQYQTPPLNVSVPSESSTDWAPIINTGLSIIPELLKNRNEVKKNDSEYNRDTSRSLQDSGNVSNQIARDTTQSSISSEESRIIIPTEQENN